VSSAWLAEGRSGFNEPASCLRLPLGLVSTIFERTTNGLERTKTDDYNCHYECDWDCNDGCRGEQHCRWSYKYNCNFNSIAFEVRHAAVSLEQFSVCVR